jgi:hypothetical protein
VTASEEARSTVAQLRLLFAGDLQRQLQTLNRLGSALSDPQVWDGSLAESFRTEIWPDCQTALEVAGRELAELHRKLHTIADSIEQAAPGPGS